MCTMFTITFMSFEICKSVTRIIFRSFARGYFGVGAVRQLCRYIRLIIGLHVLRVCVKRIDHIFMHCSIKVKYMQLCMFDPKYDKNQT